MVISLQHEEVVVAGLHGRRCQELRAVVEAGADRRRGIRCFYMMVDDVWHQFFVDHGALFWEEGICPDADNDLTAGESYQDFTSCLNIADAEIERIEFASGSTLSLRFAHDAALVLRYVADEGLIELVEVNAGRQ